MILIFTKENVCLLLPGVFIYLPNTASSMLRDRGCPELPRQSKTGLQVGEGAYLFPSHHLPEGKALWDSNLKAELPIWSETMLCLLSSLLHKTNETATQFSSYYFQSIKCLPGKSSIESWAQFSRFLPFPRF